MNNLRTSPLSSCKTFTLFLFVVHLLHRLYGVDAPGRLHPGTPYTTDSSSLGARYRLGHHATNVTQQGRYPAHDDAMTSLASPVSTSLYMAHYV